MIRYNIISIIRSGSHGLIPWLAGHYKESIYAPFWHVGIKDYDEYANVEEKLICKVHKANRKECLKHIKELSPESVFCKMENLQPKDISNKYKEDLQVKGGDLGKICDQNINIVLLRNPLNQYASILKWKYPSRFKRDPEQFCHIWHSYALEYLEETSHITDKLCVCFDKWLQDIEYRRTISQRMGKTFSDLGFGIVNKRGAGSSFEGVNKPDQKKIANRWKMFENNTNMQKVIEIINQDQAFKNIQFA